MWILIKGEAHQHWHEKLFSYDVTNKAQPTIISKTSYTGATYTHQGWVLDKNNQEWLLLDDEYDEVEGEGLAEDGRPVTYIWNIKNLAKPTQTGHYKGNVASIDHNQYIHDGKSFQSNYGSGFRILNVSSIPQDPTGKGVNEIGFFDIYPEDDYEEGGGLPRFVGSWSSYALFKSGYIFVNTIERGGYVLKYSPRADSPAPPGTKLGPKPAGWKPASQLPALGQPSLPKGSGVPWSWPQTGGSGRREESEDDD
jgi:choice-of-anchor B domain-containing protein